MLRKLLTSSIHRASILALCGALAIVALPSAAHAQGTTTATTAKVDINNATAKQLETLPGIGASTAKKIIASRPYTVVGDLSKAGVTAKTIQAITPLVIVGTPAPASATTSKDSTAKTPTKPAKPATTTTASTTPVDLNTATEAQLVALPVVGSATAKKIIAARPFKAVADLSKAGLTAKQIDTVTPLVTVGAATTAAPAAPATAPAAPAATATTATTPTKTPTTTAAPQTPPQKGMVWVNLETKVYHKEGDEYFGKTKKGKFMTEADAIKAGYHESKQGATTTKKK